MRSAAMFFRKFSICDWMRMLINRFAWLASMSIVVGCSELNSTPRKHGRHCVVRASVVDDRLTPLADVVVRIESITDSGDRMTGMTITNENGVFEFFADNSAVSSSIEVYASRLASGRTIQFADGEAIERIVVERYGSVFGSVPASPSISSVEIELPISPSYITAVLLRRSTYSPDMCVDVFQSETGVGIAHELRERRSVDVSSSRVFRFESIPSGLLSLTLMFCDCSGNILLERYYNNIDVVPGVETELTGD